MARPNDSHSVASIGPGEDPRTPWHGPPGCQHPISSASEASLSTHALLSRLKPPASVPSGASRTLPTLLVCPTGLCPPPSPTTPPEAEAQRSRDGSSPPAVGGGAALYGALTLGKNSAKCFIQLLLNIVTIPW